jgi:hypothetical protein
MTDNADEIPVSHLQRRRIESRVLLPFIEACQQKFGAEATQDLVDTMIGRLAVEDGGRWGEIYGPGLAALQQVAEQIWAGSGALELDVREASADHLAFNVTRCRYAEFYQALGRTDLGYRIHCRRDYAMIDGFDPTLSLERTQTIMEGAAHCDFRFSAVRR